MAIHAIVVKVPVYVSRLTLRLVTCPPTVSALANGATIPE